MGECNEAQTFALLGAFYDEYLADCASVNVYQYEESETWIGEWLEKGGNRDQLVYIVYHLLQLQLQVPTKYKTRNYRDNQSNLGGNLLKSMTCPLRTVFKAADGLHRHPQLFWWDFTTSVEEVMHGLNGVITANDYTRANALRLFSVYQEKWNAGYCDMEREIIPMCRDHGTGTAGWREA
ncbi:norsolorinic acid reductase A [Aspergillus awamori]|uniref:Norsolorinic acid reductase A n=1 Tax=Aspergillus awamori TaxID=105351 RepID=A0A401KJ75_ASPAW|nr:norsolorinic acid reductase A [Aspergillus awamori]